MYIYITAGETEEPQWTDEQLDATGPPPRRPVADEEKVRLINLSKNKIKISRDVWDRNTTILKLQRFNKYF